MARRRQIVERVATAVTLGASSTWTSKQVTPGIIGIAQFFVLITAVSGNATISIRGRAIEPGEAATAADFQCVARGSLSSGGSYYVGTSAGVMVNSSTVGQHAPLIWGRVDSGTSVTFDAWLVYEVEE